MDADSRSATRFHHLKHPPPFSDGLPKTSHSPFPLLHSLSWTWTLTSTSSHCRATTSAAQQAVSQSLNLCPPSLPLLSFFPRSHFHCLSTHHRSHDSAPCAQTNPCPQKTSVADNHHTRRSRMAGLRLSACTVAAEQIGTSRLSQRKSRRGPRSSIVLSGRSSPGTRIGMWRI